MSDTQTIKDRLDIVQVIGEYITLKKAGANWKANCPFHHEKSPSFMVHQDKQIWHCFGCSKGGDVFSFVQEIEGMEFVEVLKLLAKRAGVELTLRQNEGDSSQRTRLLEINTTAAYFFHRMLLDMDASRVAREYLERRQLKPETIQAWQIGFVPDQWELLTKYLLKKGHGIDDMVTAGLTIKREGADARTGKGYYDRFRGRVMFPISDTHGNVIGFTGRVLVETETSGGKYVNSPQTPLYDKSRVLYGIHKAKTAIKAADLAVLVEGQMDVVACHQAGMANVVAASGTALTIEQIKLLKRYTTNIAIAFDADAAGQNAGKRGIGIAMEEGMNIRVIQIPPGFAKDADECLKKDPAVWFKAVAEAKTVMEWYFAVTLVGVNKNDPKKKQLAAATLLTEIARLPHPVERDEWVKRLADELAIEVSILRNEVKKIVSAPKTIVRPAGSVEATTVPPPPPRPAVVISPTELEQFGHDFWSLVVQFPSEYARVRSELKLGYFASELLASLYESAERQYTTVGHLDVADLCHSFAKDGVENPIDILQLRPYKIDQLTPADAGKELGILVQRLHDTWRKLRGKELARAISQAEQAHDKATLDTLLRELQTLN